MKISKPELAEQGDDVLYRVHVSCSEGSETLWYSLSKDYADLVSDRSEAPLVALLIPAMTRGEDIHLAGTISERLYYNLSRPYQRVLRTIFPSLRPVKIYPGDVRPAPQRAPGVATGFSGGIDSFCVLADHHYYADVPAGFRVTHLLYNNVGGHSKGAGRLFRERYARIRPLAERLGLPFVAVDSNVAAFYKGFTFQQTHTPRNVSVPLLLQRGIGRFMYASAFSYAGVHVEAGHDMAHSDAITLPLLATEVLDAFSVGSEYTRVEKTLRVAGIEDSYRALEVCIQNDKAGNCCACWKCRRTLLTLEIAGVLDRYAGVFVHLDAYRRDRQRYIAQVLRSNDPMLRDVLALARKRGFAFPLSSRVYAYLGLPYVARQGKRVAGLLPRRVASKARRVLRGMA